MAEYKNLIILVIAVILALVIVLLVLKFRQMEEYFRQRNENEELSAKFEKFIRENNISVYYRMQLWLRSRGAGMLHKDFETPVVFFAMSIAVALLMHLLFGDIAATLAISTAGIVKYVPVLLGLIFPIVYLIIKDNEDNNEMLSDIDMLYNSMKTQLNNNIYATTAIYNCIELVKNKRLKDGLIEFSQNVTGSSNVKLASRNFIEKFNNTYITSLANVIIQVTLESGASGELLEDIEHQLDALQQARLEYAKEKYQSAMNRFLIMILGITISVLIAEIGSIFVRTIGEIF